MAKLTDKFFNRVIEGPLELEAGEKISGDLELASGNKAKIFENIVDKDGHARFIEGDINAKEISGITWTYAKWSLSGTHLMFVLAGNVANGTTLSFSTLGDAVLPSWIYDKIYKVAQNYVDSKSVLMYAENVTTQSLTTYLIKATKIEIAGFSSSALTADRAFRISYDLLIDNE